ncbi:MAG: hypothetical protein F2808_00145 [Actinobacteria bacterium]|uniref:Unannotated protein n=1 Tax=freshwater metagenome TaxID=449393 RepID=A0A6J7EW36_9ZZZZ|nr:hypothetical protein [Actinomycetota bacterium]
MTHPANLAAGLDRVRVILSTGAPLERALAMAEVNPTEITEINARAILAMALSTGAPAVITTDRLRKLLRDDDRASQEVQTAISAPLLARKIVMAVPGASVVLGLILGFDVLPTLFTTPLGWCCLAGGAGLSLLGAVWMRRLEARARRHVATAGLWSELAAVCVDAGLPLQVAMSLADEVFVWATRAQDLMRANANAGATGNASAKANANARSSLTAIDEGRRSARIAILAGVPVGEALRVAADEQRARNHAARLRSARELGERILIPLGACYLPAFMLWGVVPIVSGLLTESFVR